MPDSLNKPKTVAILGAGPVGLAAAAHVLERGMQPVVLEAGPQVGHAVRQWSHVPLFSPWEYAIDKASERLLTAAGWNSPAPDQYPTGGELLAQYLEPLATRTPLKDHIRTSSMVTSVGRAGFDKMKSNGRAFEPFTIRYQNGKGPEQLKADAVIDATGTWFSPNPAGADGLPAIGERETQERIAYGMPDVLGRERGRYAGRTVAVLGAGHSAIGTLIDLVRLKEEAPGTEVIWLLRGDKPEKAFGGGANDKLAARGALGAAFAKLVMDGKICVETGFRVSHIGRDGEKLRIGSGSGCMRPLRRRRRAGRGDGLPARLRLPARSPAVARSRRRVPADAGAADRSQHPQLRHGAPARRARACPARARLLLRRHEELRPRADLPDADRLRAGPLDRGRDRRRP